MEEKIADTLFLNKYSKEFEFIFKEYDDEVNANIIWYEFLENETPIAILNEIRSMMTHMARIAVADKECEELSNIEKIKSHKKRATLDCYKYLCMSVSSKYNNFFSEYNGIDFSKINNGTFCVDISKKYNEAQKQLINAKIEEGRNAPTEKLIELYRDANSTYAEVYKMLKDGETYADDLLKEHKLNQEIKNKNSKMTFIGYVLAAIAVIVGIVTGIVF